MVFSKLWQLSSKDTYAWNLSWFSYIILESQYRWSSLSKFLQDTHLIKNTKKDNNLKLAFQILFKPIYLTPWLYHDTAYYKVNKLQQVPKIAHILDSIAKKWSIYSEPINGVSRTHHTQIWALYALNGVSRTHQT